MLDKKSLSHSRGSRRGPRSGNLLDKKSMQLELMKTDAEILYTMSAGHWKEDIEQIVDLIEKKQQLLRQ